MSFNSSEAYTTHQNPAEFRIPLYSFKNTESGPRRTDPIEPVLDEILANHEAAISPILENPIFIDAVVHHGVTEEQILQALEPKITIDPADPLKAEKEALIPQCKIDAKRLVERVNEFEKAFSQEFAGSALMDRSKKCTLELVFKLRRFLHNWLPNFIPAWDCYPFTQYSLETQRENFRKKILPHIDCDVLYVNEYAAAWNDKVEAQDLSQEEKEKLKIDANFLMCKGLIHDLGRWFTQDSRAHEEIPAGIAVATGLHSDFLTLEDGDPGTHPREFSVTDPMTLENIQLIFEFFADFFSKPHKDNIWPETVVLFKTPVDHPDFEARMETVARLEKLRQSEMRHPELGIFYMWYASNGYKEIDASIQSDWQPAFREKFKNNPDKLKYYLTEGGMLETGRVFLDAIGISPSMIREKVMGKRALMDYSFDPFEQCFIPKLT